MRHTIKMLGLVFVLALSACGGEDGDDFGRFVGTWRATAGTVTTICPGYGTFTEALTGNRLEHRRQLGPGGDDCAHHLPAHG